VTIRPGRGCRWKVLTDYLDNSPRRYQQTFIVGNAQYNGSVRQLSFYGDAKLPLAKTLTLTAGLRWDGRGIRSPGIQISRSNRQHISLTI
jgi:outer membrane receptor protein involved in Fe transport